MVVLRSVCVCVLRMGADIYYTLTEADDLAIFSPHLIPSCKGLCVPGENSVRGCSADLRATVP